MPKQAPVYLSAPGLLCCAGDRGDRFFAAAQQGDRRGMVPFPLFGGSDSSGERSFWAGRIPDEFFPPAGNVREESRIFRIADTALEQIRPEVEQVVAAYGPDRVGVCIGSCDNGSALSLEAHRAYFTTGRFPENYALRYQGAAYPAEYIARRFGLAGPVLTVSVACASGAGAISQGAVLIRGGFCDAVIAGGVDIVSQTVLLGFDSLEAVSDAPCNPFSKNRNGITLGEGAAFFVLSREFRGVPITLLGVGESADAFHITAPRPDGGGAIRAMKDALADAGIGPGDVGYLNLHGTGTPLNDAMEALAVAAVFPDAAAGPPVSSTKSITGHTLGAAGALELALCWLALSTAGEWLPIPVHVWDGVYDEDLPLLRFAGRGTMVEDLRICMSNSFAFGGCNISLIIGRED
ncbi:3-oxoacyl-ACP synthase [Treponema sp. TIM-1]|uniref:beta-ketoacyl synthase N-terminal-like domain-containing protein n=1 Tax=Treponema sp. TIM-1 TaxID=2898417 RepID=UPI00397EBB68